MRSIKAWALVEKQGGRKGKFLSMDYTPYWHPIKAAVFAKRRDAISYVEQLKLTSLVSIVRVEITIEEKGTEDE